MFTTFVAVLSAWTVLLLSYNVVLFLRQGKANATSQYKRGVQTGLIALLTVAALVPATDLMAQSFQKLSKSTAKLPLSTAFGVYQLYPGSTKHFEAFITSGAVKAIYNGIFGDAVPFEIDCPTGNCAWDKPYTSLAICSACTDLTSELKPLTDDEGQEVGVLLPNDFPLRYNANQGWPMGERQMYVSMNVTSAPAGQPPALKVLEYESIAYRDMSGKVLDTFVVVGGDPSARQYMSEFPAPAAYECALQWCLQQSTAKVVDGKFTEKLVNIINDTTVDIHNYTLEISRQLTDPKTDMVYNVSSRSEHIYFSLFAHKFNGTRSANLSDADVLTALWSAVARPEGSPAKYFDQIASSFNTYMRTQNSAIIDANYSTAEGVVFDSKAAPSPVLLPAFFTYPVLLLAAIVLMVLASRQPQASVQLGLDDASASLLHDAKEEAL